MAARAVKTHLPAISGPDFAPDATVAGAELDILSALKGEDSHDTVPLGWDGYGL